ncbi:unnamed protein product, partial [Mesorhabditis belari]|uniref:Uncharacterized protein n=1 Tax=Mesorhabditis belari TaxID=2138241 RepID=A0A915G0Y5_9BILA
MSLTDAHRLIYGQYELSCEQAYKLTVWAACRAVIFGCIVISVGLGMTALGYFDKHFSMYTEHINGTEIERIDRVIAYQLKSLQYIGPILMGIGTFVLIIACVITLESRDKHTQVIHEESQEIRRRRQQSIDDDREQLIIDGGNHCIEQQSEIHTVSKRDSRRESGLSKCSTGTATSGSPLFARVPRRLSQGPAPLAEVDESLNNSIQSINEQHIPQSG